LVVFYKLQAPPVLTFDLGRFTFILLDDDDARIDMFHYVVTHGNVTIEVSVFGIDTDNHGGPLSNINLVFFMWDNLLRFSFKKLALAFSTRSDEALLPKLMCLQH
jgi:hypothetical protein